MPGNILLIFTTAARDNNYYEAHFTDQERQMDNSNRTEHKPKQYDSSIHMLYNLQCIITL